MGTLKTHRLDFNSAKVVSAVIESAKRLARKKVHRTAILHSAPFCFSIPDGEIPSGPGWYILVADGEAIYVGEAANLRNRLNTPNGSLDNFAAKRRTSDSTRNFIKKFVELEIIRHPEVIFITEADLVTSVGGAFLPSPLDKCERQSIEKLINIFRGTIVPR